MIIIDVSLYHTVGVHIIATPETSCQGLFIKKISNSIICCTMLVVYVIWLYN